MGSGPSCPPHTDDWEVGAVPVHICVPQTDYIEQDRKSVPRGYPAAFQFVGGFVILNMSVSASPENGDSQISEPHLRAFKHV